ncbi:MAG: choline kinase family protein [Pseudomonadota bacterium]
MSNRLTLAEALARLPGAVDDTSVAAIGQTSTSAVYRLRLNGSDVVLRIGDRDADTRAALAIQRSAAERGLSPAVLLAAPDAGLIVTAFAAGQALMTRELHAPATLQAIGRLLRRLHSGAPTGHRLDLLAAVQRYVANCPAAVQPLAERIATEIREQIASVTPLSLVPCHNDPVAANFLVGSALQLIDFEYAADNDPRFDLAVVSAHHALDSDARRRLLRAYAPDDIDCFAADFAIWESIYRGLHVLWASARGPVPPTSRCEVP